MDPKSDEIKALDIAHGLSLLCRANGHYKHFYSVAQHSICCASEANARGLSRRIQLACLLHDASEAYIGDLTRPIKSVLDKYRDIETHLQEKIYAAFGLADLSDDELKWVKQIDDAMLKYEMVHLLDNQEISGGILLRDYDLSFRMMEEVRTAFLAHLKNLLADSAKVS